MVKMPEETLYDIRLLTRHLNDGLITQSDFDNFLKQLPDASENVEMISMEEMMLEAKSR